MTLVARWREQIVFPVSAVASSESVEEIADNVIRKSYTEHSITIEEFGITDPAWGPTRPLYAAIIHKVDGEIMQEQRFENYKAAKEAALYRYPKPWPCHP